MSQATTTLQNQTNMHDDATHDAGGQAVTGLGLGSSSSQVDFNNDSKYYSRSSEYWDRYAEYQKKLFETDPNITDKNPTSATKPTEKEQTHGDLASQLYNSEKELSTLDSILNSNGFMNNKPIWNMKELYDAGLLEKSEVPLVMGSKKEQEIRDLVNQRINDKRIELENVINGIKTNPNYDSRSQEQIREDDIRTDLQELENTKYQREVDDMTKAGLNKALMFSTGGSGGGVASGSNKAESEEERRRRKKREERELALKQQAEERAKTQQMINLIMGIAGASSMAGLGLSNVATNKANIAERARQFDAQAPDRAARTFRDDSQGMYTREKWYSMLDKKGKNLR